MATVTGGSRISATLKRIHDKLSNATQVDIGFLDRATYPDGTFVATAAAANEFGTANSPPRPYFRNMITGNSAKWPTNLRTALANTDYDAAASLGQIGQEIQEELQESIRSNTPPPNAPSTVAKKGFDRTLVDTGTMLNSVTHNVK
jgi:hypothetical protein